MGGKGSGRKPQYSDPYHAAWRAIAREGYLIRKVREAVASAEQKTRRATK